MKSDWLYSFLALSTASLVLTLPSYNGASQAQGDVEANPVIIHGSKPSSGSEAAAIETSRDKFATDQLNLFVADREKRRDCCQQSGLTGFLHDKLTKACKFQASLYL